VADIKSESPAGLPRNSQRMNAGEKKWLDPASSRSITAHGFRASFRTWRRKSRRFVRAESGGQGYSAEQGRQIVMRP
jgi:hypothetical protein